MKAKTLRKIREFLKADATCKKIIEKVAEEDTDDSPQMHWKFAVKATYLKVLMLAGAMEFAKPKNLMVSYAKPLLIRILKQFMPELTVAKTEEAEAKET